MADKNGKLHSDYVRTYYFSKRYREDVEYDEEYDNFDIEDLDEEDITRTHTYYWHGQNVSYEKYTQKIKQHDKWLKGMAALDLSAFQKLLENPDFVIDFVGSMDLQEAFVKAPTISAKDFAGIKSGNKEVSDAIAFLTPFKKDLEKGIITTFYDRGTVKERFQLKEGKKNGFYELYEEFGEIKEKATYQNDELDGPREEYHNGKLWIKSNYKKGKLDGPCEKDGRHLWIPAGITKCHYKDGVLDGPYLRDTRMSCAEYIFMEGTYRDGKFSGICIGRRISLPGFRSSFMDSWFDHPCKEVHYTDGVESGPCRVYHGYDEQPDGSYKFGPIAAKCTYKNGKLDGLYEEWSKEGKLLKKCRYIDGVLNGLCEEYHENGSLKSKVVYKNGEIDKSPLAKDKTSVVRRGFLKVLDAVNRMPPSQRRASIKRTITKGYRLITPKTKPKRSGR